MGGCRDKKAAASFDPKDFARRQVNSFTQAAQGSFDILKISSPIWLKFTYNKYHTFPLQSSEKWTHLD